MDTPKPSPTPLGLGWNRTSYGLLSLFLLTIGLILWVWWPMVQDYVSTYDPSLPFWIQFDWLLLGIFVAMTVLVMCGADLRRDVWIVAVGIMGGLVIESWGTQTQLWTYFTLERPPLWIIPAWPVASLSIDRLERLLDALVPPLPPRWVGAIYWVVFPAFYLLMLFFVFPTLNRSLTWMALLVCALLIVSPAQKRTVLFTFFAGSALGYFLERWGTTRQCWTYYTQQTPPLFAVLAHGLAAVAFWQTGRLARQIGARFLPAIHLLPEDARE